MRHQPDHVPLRRTMVVQSAPLRASEARATRSGDDAR